MGSFLYSWATDLRDLCSLDQFSQFYNHYFEESSVCLEVFGLGLGIALLVAVVFYFAICNKSYALAKRVTWIFALLITAAAVYFGSDYYMVGHDGGDSTASSGVYLDSYTFQDANSELLGENDDELTEWNSLADDFRQAVTTGDVTITQRIAVINMVYAIIFFIVLSIVFKRFTIHGRAIPF